ncbi:uncharacterized protein LOC117193413 isoform X1 [Drosophila miranda]|uniref:uncharacterized protein LOC117193413 isoform X1 n=1 Tax=Drosophila miranda TaxID=7229 RepID=UPI00143F7C0E|nr:uncharacterized protein LOC117193413 isoform X1 [Drosophila miranda]
MENSAGIGDLASVSFADFGTKTSGEDGPCYESYVQQPKHDMTLNLSLGQKENLFAADQTPTPTRLIKNCDEVGLFEDLQHVNPFDIGFQRAAEQNVSGTPNRPEAPQNDGEPLHTPQVYPLETVSVHTTAPPPVPVGTVMRSESCSSINVEQLLASDTTTATTTVCAEDPLPIQLIQPQVIAWVLPAQTDCMERRRAAASRYRNKMRNEQKDLWMQNSQLQQQNQDLRERIARLEKELNQHNSSMVGVVANQLKIPPSSIHLLINVPSMLVPSSAQITSVDIK